MRLAPDFSGIIHHEVNEERDEQPHDRRAITHLGAVDAAVPGGAAMHQLVTQDIKPVENAGEDKLGILPR